MTPEAQRIAIAKACKISLTAYRFQFKSPGSIWAWSTRYKTSEEAQEVSDNEARRWGSKMQPVEPYEEPSFAPNYLSDLNAMQDARKILTEEQRREFTERLLDIVGADRQHLGTGINTTWACRRHELSKLTEATAAQLAQAFVETLNLEEA